MPSRSDSLLTRIETNDSALESASFEDRHLSKGEGQRLAEAIKKNQSLSSVSFANCTFENAEETLSLFATAMQENRTIKAVEIFPCRNDTPTISKALQDIEEAVSNNQRNNFSM